MYEVIMPKLGLTMESGKIEKWHKKEGDKVETGDILFEVMTDKVSLEVESYNSGILRKILKSEGEEVPVTEVVAYIGRKDEDIPDSIEKGSADIEGKEEDQVKVKEIIETEKSKVGSDLKGSSGEKRIRISPLARKVAKELEIDWKSSNIPGRGPRGRILKADIISYNNKRKDRSVEVPDKGELRIRSKTELSGMRKVISERMTLSKTTIPHIVLNSKANVSELVNLREGLKNKILEKRNIKITFTDFILKAVAVSLRENISINSSLQENQHIIYEDVNVGIAVAIEDGLIVPTIDSCDKLGITDIAEKRIELIQKAKNNDLGLDEIQNGTFTVTNLGMYGIRNFSAVINPPQAAILGVGEIYSEPMFDDNNVIEGRFMDLSLAADHRIIDGAVAARFLQNIVRLVEDPLTAMI
jgi:pyruvate dehydrogenase E2 component (dihydrolipoamide acetyltransferase)